MVDVYVGGFDDKDVKELLEYIKKELGYSEEDLEYSTIYDYDSLYDRFEEWLKESLADLWEKLKYYIDIDKMIRDEINYGGIIEFEFKGKKLYLEPQ